MELTKCQRDVVEVVRRESIALWHYHRTQITPEHSPAVTEFVENSLRNWELPTAEQLVESFGSVRKRLRDADLYLG